MIINMFQYHFIVKINFFKNWIFFFEMLLKVFVLWEVSRRIISTKMPLLWVIFCNIRHLSHSVFRSVTLSDCVSLRSFSCIFAHDAQHHNHYYLRISWFREARIQGGERGGTPLNSYPAGVKKWMPFSWKSGTSRRKASRRTSATSSWLNSYIR